MEAILLYRCLSVLRTRQNLQSRTGLFIARNHLAPRFIARIGMCPFVLVSFI
jgi:hypothetical protein